MNKIITINVHKRIQQKISTIVGTNVAPVPVIPKFIIMADEKKSIAIISV
jgi:hypothetical protein